MLKTFSLHLFVLFLRRGRDFFLLFRNKNKKRRRKEKKKNNKKGLREARGASTAKSTRTRTTKDEISAKISRKRIELKTP